MGSGSSSAIRTPAFRSFSSNFRFPRSWNHSYTLWAISGPIPSTTLISSTVAFFSRSVEGNARARTWATCQPTWRMFRATRSLHTDRSFEASMAVMRFSIFFSLNPGSWASCSRVSE